MVYTLAVERVGHTLLIMTHELLRFVVITVRFLV